MATQEDALRQGDMGGRTAGVLLLLVVAAAYMRLGLFVPINWSDEGIIVYPIWRVAEGEIPYRDFHHLYGPSVFYLNGLLLRIFGLDLAVLRYFLLGVKAVLCVMVYLAARSISSRLFALMAYGLAVVMAGLVWPISTVPYPHIFGTALCLGGLLAFLAAERRFLLGCVMAGFCFGLAATFKQTTGAFAFLGMALFLLFPIEQDEERERGKQEGEAEGSRAGPLLELVARSSRWFVLVFAACLSAFYLVPRTPVWNLVLLAGPVAVLWAHLALREWHHPPNPASQVRSFWSLVALSVAFLIPPLGYAVYYISLDLGSAILFDTLVGLPGVIDWTSPYPVPGWNFVLWQTACLGGFGGAALWHRRPTNALRDGRALAGALLGVLSIVSLGALVYRGWGQRHALWWFWGMSDLLFSLHFVLVWTALIALLRRDRDLVGDGALASDRAFRLWTCHATLGLMWLFPVAEIWHLVQLLPSFLPLLPWLLEGFWRLPAAEGRTDPRWRPLAGSLVCALCLVLVVPAMHDVLAERARPPAFRESLPRATGVVGGSAMMTYQAGQMVRYLVQPERRDEPLLVLSGKSLFYFLTDRVSPLQEFEFTLYLVGIDAIPPDRARSMADEGAMIQRIRAVRPLILYDATDSAAQNIRTTYPLLTRFIRSHYRREKAFGGFHIWRWRSEAAGS